MQLTKKEERKLEADERMGDLKQEYESILTQVDTEHWEQKRIARPWESQ
jgi:hypothetical protein